MQEGFLAVVNTQHRSEDVQGKRLGRVARTTTLNTKGDPTEDESSKQVGQRDRRTIPLLSCPSDVRHEIFKAEQGRSREGKRMKEREAGAFGKEAQP